MTRKDYIAIASVFASVQRDDSEESYRTWIRLRGYMMNILSTDNPRFCRSKFKEATEHEHT